MLQRNHFHKNFPTEFSPCLFMTPRLSYPYWIQEKKMISIYQAKQFKSRSWQLLKERI